MNSPFPLIPLEYLVDFHTETGDQKFKSKGVLWVPCFHLQWIEAENWEGWRMDNAFLMLIYPHVDKSCWTPSAGFWWYHWKITAICRRREDMWRFCPPYTALAQSDAGCLFFCNSLTYSTYVKPWKFQSVYSAKSFFQFQIFRWMHRVNILYSRTWHALCYPSILQGKPSLRDNFHETNPSELAAFCSYALAFPTAFQALVDTYDVKRWTLFLSASLVCLGLPFCSMIALSDDCLVGDAHQCSGLRFYRYR